MDTSMHADVPPPNGPATAPTTAIQPGLPPPSLTPPLPPTPMSWRLAIAGAIIAIAGIAYVTQPLIGTRGQALAGIVFFFGLVAVFSTNLRAVNWRTIGWGVALQLALALLVL